MRTFAFALLLLPAMLLAQSKTPPIEAPPITVTVDAAPAAITNPTTPDQVREYLKLTQFGEIWRAGWLRAMDENRSKGAPYWPDSFWNDLKRHMESVDIVPMITGLYRNHVSFEDMKRANEELKKISISDFAATPFGSHFCHETQLSGSENEAATYQLTQTVFMRVYADHKAEIKIARAKYLADHPGFVDPPPR